MKILSVVGARPQFVKAAVLSRLFPVHGIEEILVHTGQHFDHGMSDVFFEEMRIPKPQYNLGVNGMTHGAMTGAMLSGIEEILLKEKPDAVLVYGDTNSTLAGALAAKKIHIPVVHVEAGLRSFNMQMPEEVNRILTDRISDILFAPTQAAINNLSKEGFENIDTKVIRSGDVMQDAALFYAELIGKEKGVLANLESDKFILCTLHRAENTDDVQRLKALVDGLNEIHETTNVVLPLHPRTKAVIEREGIELKVDIIDPVGYFDMIRLLKNCQMVITDSGGLQKEAYFFKKACVTMRDQTEWVELIENGFNVLVGADKQKLVEEVTNFKNKELNFNVDLYGNGLAGKNMVEYLKQNL